jgi:hypothetical protein
VEACEVLLPHRRHFYVDKVIFNSYEMSYIQTKYPSGPFDPFQIQRVVSLNGISGQVTLASSETIHVNSNGSSLSLDVVGSSPGGGGGGTSGTFTGFPVPAYTRKMLLEGFTVGSVIIPPEDGWIQIVKANPATNTVYEVSVNEMTVWQVTPSDNKDILSGLIPVRAGDYITNRMTLVTFIWFYPIRTAEEGNEGMA